MVVEGDGEDERDDEEHGQRPLAAAAEREQAEHEGEHHGPFRHDHVDHDRADEETLLALEQSAARGTVMPHLEGRSKDARTPARGANQSRNESASID